MKSVGAVYCVYDDSGFLAESVKRVYPLMDKILFLVNFKPWCGDPDPSAVSRTINTITSMPDPDNKIEIISKYWATEADQRNFGTKTLRQAGLAWHAIIDDDEMFNRSELEWLLNAIDINQHACYLINHQIYWKSRDLVMDMDPFALNGVISTIENLCQFHLNRMVMVYNGKTWTSFPGDKVTCHHMSYVRSDEKMLRKIQTFSHANELVPNWYEEKWLKWTPEMTALHPMNPAGFRKVISIDVAPYKLEQV